MSKSLRPVEPPKLPVFASRYSSCVSVIAGVDATLYVLKFMSTAEDVHEPPLSFEKKFVPANEFVFSPNQLMQFELSAPSSKSTIAYSVPFTIETAD